MFCSWSHPLRPHPPPSEQQHSFLLPWHRYSTTRMFSPGSPQTSFLSQSSFYTDICQRRHRNLEQGTVNSNAITAAGWRDGSRVKSHAALPEHSGAVPAPTGGQLTTTNPSSSHTFIRAFRNPQTSGTDSVQTHRGKFNKREENRKLLDTSVRDSSWASGRTAPSPPQRRTCSRCSAASAQRSSTGGY